MDEGHFQELNNRFCELNKVGFFTGKEVFFFGHCNATETMVDLFLENDIIPFGILDNSTSKIGMKYRGITVISPENITNNSNVVVCICARAYSAMKQLLRKEVLYPEFIEFSRNAERMYLF